MLPLRCCQGGNGEGEEDLAILLSGLQYESRGRYDYGNKMLIRAVALKYILFSVLSPYIF